MNQSKQAWLGLRGERHICIYSPNRRIPQPLGQSMQTRHFFFDFIPSVSGPLHTVHLPLSKPVTELQSHQMVILCSIPTALIIIYQPSRTSIHPCIKTLCYPSPPYRALSFDRTQLFLTEQMKTTHTLDLSGGIRGCRLSQPTKISKHDPPTPASLLLYSG